MLYTILKFYIKFGLFFYSKKIRISGLKNIPKKGAVMFAVNHPNGLIDSLFITTNCPRKNYYLVRASAFKKPLIKKILNALNLMPVYRIRDGLNQVSKNLEVFEQCYKLFNNQKVLMIFPEASHNAKRTVRNLSKGFTRIVFGAIDKNPNLKITIIPVGVTYQNVGVFPTKIAIKFGIPFQVNSYYDSNDVHQSANIIKEKVSNQLKKLSVHIPDDKNYNYILQKLNDAQVDFTDVNKVNEMIQNKRFPESKLTPKNHLKPLYYLIIINSFIPFLIWKKISKKIDELEFVDTFKMTLNIFVFPIYYGIQSVIISFFFGWEIAGIYFLFSLFLVLIYAKLAPTPTPEHLV